MPFLLEFFVFHRNHIVLLNLISRCMTSTSEYLFKNKDIVDLGIVNFCVRKLFIQCITGSPVHSLSIFVLVCPVCLSVFVLLNHSGSKNHVIRIKPVVNSRSCCKNTHTKV